MRRGDRSGGLDGVLIVSKPSGPTSHDVVGLVRRLSSTRRVGHGGTLDPFAAGVLPVFLGRATRLAQYLAGVDKEFDGEAIPMPNMRIGLLPQEPQLDEDRDVRGNVEQGVGDKVVMPIVMEFRLRI